MTNRHSPRRVVITAGPTQEPIDAVRYLANRSSGRLGEALAEEAGRRGWDVTLLLGPVERSANYTRVQVERFTTTHNLQELLQEHAPQCDILIMAAAVADFRPSSPAPAKKLQRGAGTMNLPLEPTPDLLAAIAKRRRPGQTLVGFALEPRERLLEFAKAKLERKKIDAIVANPLETMGSDTIEATLIWKDGAQDQTAGAIAKVEFAAWLLDRLEERRAPNAADGARTS